MKSLKVTLLYCQSSASFMLLAFMFGFGNPFRLESDEVMRVQVMATTLQSHRSSLQSIT